MSPWTFFFEHRSEILEATLAHLTLVAVAMIFAIGLGVPLGMLAVQRPALRKIALGVASVFQTIPSLALFGFLIPIPFIGGIGKRTAAAAPFDYKPGGAVPFPDAPIGRRPLVAYIWI